ncbi:MAG: ribonuclease H-like domain-containing protein [Tissierellia bacterium]|nr:ribonuclease H-like domain-containing protein [Tissierellia bacterium]
MIDEKIIYDAKNLNKNQLVLDIETTGLSRQFDTIVMIGMIYYEQKNFFIRQIFATNDQQEKDLLIIFKNISKDKQIITYNGDSFDLEFINQRLINNNLEAIFFENTIDIYKVVRDYQKFFNFPSLKLDYIETLLDIKRVEDDRKRVVSKLSKEVLVRDNPTPIIKHNRNDVISTEKLITIEDVFTYKLSFYSKFLDANLCLKNSIIEKNLIHLTYISSIKLNKSFYEFSDFCISIDEYQVNIRINVLYGKISENNFGYVVKNIFKLEDKSSYDISKDYLLFKNSNTYLYKNINAHTRKILESI